jgi:hypothetical protein
MKQVYIGYYDISNSSISALNIIKNVLIKKKENFQVEMMKNIEIIHYKNFKFILFPKEEILETLNLFFNSYLVKDEEWNVLSCCLEDKNGKLKDTFLNTFLLFSNLKEVKVNLLKFKGFKNETRIDDFLNLFISHKIFEDLHSFQLEFQIKNQEIIVQDILYN